ncbi:MAG: HU family DNA-binding protein [Paludibacter sp.]|nr:HU family DNA-binding protein [Bacteroidales bacterium]MCM1068891.1 HU family DNA-binding protein [Prevotella sp.]MCM1353152.1 HU family DNA-binding protein [Bacteroides sp.]MCM1442474.1 HU family DNA-binding protein [Muribaculum sp.]MCM1481317.1 HU family DNA-binding protein [Paludibacter sp.]
MTDERITLVTLRKLLAEKTGCSEQEAGTFLNRLFVSIVNGLKEDGQVRISGFGTFKVQWTAPRRSVNIQTGEPITLDGYNKVTFVPENNLKERINEPFAHLEAVVIDGTEKSDVPANPLQKLDEQAEEIKDILAELGVVTSTPTATACEQNAPEISIPIVTEEKEDAPTIAQSQTASEEIAIDTPTTETPIESPTETINGTSKESAEVMIPDTKTGKTTKERPFHPWMAAGITMLIFCLLLTGGYFFLQHKITSWADNMLSQQAEPNQTILPTTPDSKNSTSIALPDSSIATQVPDSNLCTEVILEDTLTATTETSLQRPTAYTDFITTETLTEGSRLTWLARKYYGAFEFWVYIYEANKDRLPNPNNIGVGTQIRIPKLPKELIDTTNEESMQLARQLHEEILGL